jgi:hypothetical protein
VPPSAVSCLVLGVGGCSWRSSSQIFNVHEHNIPARSAKVFFGSGFCGLIRAGKVQPDLFGIEDEDAVIAERDFLGLPGGIVAVRVPCLWKLISSASAGLRHAAQLDWRTSIFDTSSLVWSQPDQVKRNASRTTRATASHPAPHPLSPCQRLHAPGVVLPPSPQPGPGDG